MSEDVKRSNKVADRVRETIRRDPMPDDRPVSPEERVREVTLTLCELCMDGQGGECHTPGCALYMNRAPDVPLFSLSTPARPSPEPGSWSYCPTCGGSGTCPPSPREEAWAQIDAASPLPADALGREEAVEDAAKALLNALDVARPRSIVEMRSNDLRAALAAARPSSPTPEEDGSYSARASHLLDPAACELEPVDA